MASDRRDSGADLIEDLQVETNRGLGDAAEPMQCTTVVPPCRSVDVSWVCG